MKPRLQVAAVEDLLGRSRLEQLPLGQDRDPVGEGERLGLLVGHVHAGDPALPIILYYVIDKKYIYILFQYKKQITIQIKI